MAGKNKPGNPNIVPGNKYGKQFSSDYQPENNGRKPGISRSTIAKKVLSMSGILPDEMFEALKAIFPEIERNMTFEEIGSIALAANMVKGDVNSYKALMDSAYGAPKQEIDHSGNLPTAVPEIRVYNSAPPFASSENDV